MTPIDERIIELKTEDLDWPFEGGACFKTGDPKGGYSRSISVDPFPCYPHNTDLVRESVAQVEAAFPIKFLPTYYALHHEATGRTNGHTRRVDIYDCKYGEYTGWWPFIVLFGKRIPIHPGMTRYLVAHEYGHVVQYWIEHKRGIKDASITEFDREYLKLRPQAEHGYGGLKWHKEVGELIANDFRICVTAIEKEYWPHPGFEHPMRLPEVRAFWGRMVEEFSYRPEQEAA
jgi:hypothetical protein